jgi:hypothetical protein
MQVIEILADLRWVLTGQTGDRWHLVKLAASYGNRMSEVPDAPPRS